MTKTTTHKHSPLKNGSNAIDIVGSDGSSMKTHEGSPLSSSPLSSSPLSSLAFSASALSSSTSSSSRSHKKDKKDKDKEKEKDKDETGSVEKEKKKKKKKKTSLVEEVLTGTPTRVRSASVAGSPYGSMSRVASIECVFGAPSTKTNPEAPLTEKVVAPPVSKLSASSPAAPRSPPPVDSNDIFAPTPTVTVTSTDSFELEQQALLESRASRMRSASVAGVGDQPSAYSGLRPSAFDPFSTSSSSSSSSSPLDQAALDPTTILKESLIFKKTKLSSRAQKRYAILRSRTLSIFPKTPSSSSGLGTPEMIMSLGDFVVGKQFVSNEYIVVMKSIAGGSDFMFMPRESADTESWINLIQTLQAKLTREMFNTQSPMRFTSSSSAETVSLKPRVRDPRRMSVSSLFSSGSSSQNLLLFNSMRQSNESKLEPAMSSSAPSTPSTKKTMTVKEKRTSRFLKSSSTASIPVPIKKPGLVFGVELDKITKLNADLSIPQIVIDTTSFLSDKGMFLFPLLIVFLLMKDVW
eukprot:TRINITY_DN1856_c0_g1_i1.p1 TRINITY_DN1856_c0_g1~~TRINITY_DN1856_c0_g1_i1.p1  ORF type:complete len:522 (+),score=227.19 TRINITY_DN1856_c0_g1_i1:238-1803(+)